MRFRVIGGKFTERIVKGDRTRRGKTYKKGAFVDSDVDLTQIFRNVFEKVADDAEPEEVVHVPPPKIPVPKLTLPPDAPPSAPVQSKKKRGPEKYKVSAPPAAPPPPTAKKVEASAIKVEASAIPEPPPKAPKPKKSKLGIDVTDRYPAAEKNNLKVFRKGKFYSITEDSDWDIPVSKGKKPLTKVQVDKFLKDIPE